MYVLLSDLSELSEQVDKCLAYRTRAFNRASVDGGSVQSCCGEDKQSVISVGFKTYERIVLISRCVWRWVFEFREMF